MSESNSESDDDMPKMPTVKPNPYSKKLPFDHLLNPRSKVETRNNNSSHESSGDEEQQGKIISEKYLGS